MKTRIAINGFGRIGRNAFRAAFERDDIEVVAINDIADSKTLSFLLKHDSIYGTYSHKVNFDDQNLIVDDKKIKVINQTDPSLLPWNELDIDIVIEATGRLVDSDQAQLHINPSGARKVIITAPVKNDNTKTIVIGVNDDELVSAGDVISNASCTTNCIAPIMDILNQKFGVEKAMMTTTHSYTQSQRFT